MTITDATTYAGWIAGLAIVALIATAWRRSAPATVHHDDPTAPANDEHWALAELHAPLDTPVPWTKKAWSAVASFGLAIWVGAALATVIGFGAAFLVITLTNMLKQ